MNRTARREKINHRTPMLKNNEWVWRNWIKNGFRKASAIDFSHNGYCALQKIRTDRADIFCLSDRSPVIVRNMRTLLIDLYKASSETAPIFVDHHIFERIKAVEHGL